MKTNQTAHGGQRGWTLIETCMVLCTIALVVGITAPSFKAARERRHLEAAAAQLHTDLAFARSLAVARNQPVRMSFARSTTGSCYVVHSGPADACDCLAGPAPVCTGGAQVFQSGRFSDDKGMVLTASASSMLFDERLGTVTPTSTMHLRSASGLEIRKIINILGRVRHCSPAPSMPGYPAC